MYNAKFINKYISSNAVYYLYVPKTVEISAALLFQSLLYNRAQLWNNLDIEDKQFQD